MFAYVRRAKERSERGGEAGFTLLDVILAMVIIGLLTGIALSAVGNLRARAYQTGAISDVKQVAVALEAAATDGSAYPSSLTSTPGGAVTLTVSGVTETIANLTDGNSIPTGNAGYQRVAATSGPSGVPESFTVCVQHTSGAFAKFNSANGKITHRGTKGNCPS